jgi:hypothetical protein
MRNKRILIIICILSFILIFGFKRFAIAQNRQSNFEEVLSQEGITPQEYDEVITYYYKNPQPEKIIPIIKAVLTQEQFISDNIKFIPFAHLVAAIAHNNSNILTELKGLRENNLPNFQKERVQYIIEETENYNSMLPDTPTAEDLDRYLLVDMYAPTRIDCLWSEFFATGDEKAIEKIISILAYPAAKDKDFIIATKASAEWSLTSNARQHKKVYEIIEKKLSSVAGELKEKLQNILKRAQEPG